MSNAQKGAAISLGFSGDVSFSGFYTEKYKEDLLSGEIKEFFASNDANIINFESPVTACRVTKKGYLAHRSDPEALNFVTENIKNPILSFANNHMMDFGDIGVADTVDYTSAAGIPIIGMGINTKMASNGKIIGEDLKIGVFSFEYKDKKIATDLHGGPLHESSMNLIEKTINELREECDYVVAVYHGGEEFTRAPMPYTRKMLKKILALGADAVVAHHSHVVQGYERVGKKMIFYSLGNFIFDTNYQRIQDYTDQGMLLRLNFTKEGFDFAYLPIRINRENQKITAGEPIDSFRDVNEGFFKAWCTECVRMEIVKIRKKRLKTETKEATQAAKNEKRERVQAIIRSDPELYDDEKFLLEETAPVQGEKPVRKKSLRRRCLRVAKFLYRRLIVKRKETYKGLVKRFGALTAKTVFHVKMEP